MTQGSVYKTRGVGAAKLFCKFDALVYDNFVGGFFVNGQFVSREPENGQIDGIQFGERPFGSGTFDEGVDFIQLVPDKFYVWGWFFLKRSGEQVLDESDPLAMAGIRGGFHLTFCRL